MSPPGADQGLPDLAGVDEAREVVRETTSAIVIIRGRSNAIWKFTSIPRPCAN